MKEKIKEYIPYIIIFIIVVLLRSFIITPVVVVGSSMENTLYDDEVLLLSKISYKINDIKRYDIIVIDNDNDRIIKRVIGLPGDYIAYRNNKLFINNKLVKDKYATNETSDFDLRNLCKCDKIPKDKYLVLGDNREVSLDSRTFGLVDKKDILGKTVVRIWPINKIGSIK